MSASNEDLKDMIGQQYKDGFVTDIESDSFEPGLNEDVIRKLSAIKEEPEFLLEWRLEAYRHWLTMEHPEWAFVEFPKIDFNDISYYSAPKSMADGPKSLDEVDPELISTYNKLGIPLEEQMRLAGVAVDAVFDSVSVATTFKDKLAEAGVIFCSFSACTPMYPTAQTVTLGKMVSCSTKYECEEVSKASNS